VRAAAPGDVLYLDPPYLDTFDGYTAGGFSYTDHLRLAAALAAAVVRGVKVVVSQAQHPALASLYPWGRVIPVSERRAIAVHRSTTPRRDAAVVVVSRGLVPTRWQPTSGKESDDDE
jgi:site-specific DNA-adenine methylase